MKKLHQLAQLSSRLAGNTKSQRGLIRAAYEIMAHMPAQRAASGVRVKFFGNVWEFHTNRAGRVDYCFIMDTTANAIQRGWWKEQKEND